MAGGERRCIIFETACVSIFCRPLHIYQDRIHIPLISHALGLITQHQLSECLKPGVTNPTNAKDIRDAKTRTHTPRRSRQLVKILSHTLSRYGGDAYYAWVCAILSGRARTTGNVPPLVRPKRIWPGVGIFFIPTTFFICMMTGWW